MSKPSNEELCQQLINVLLAYDDRSFDPSMKTLVQKWSIPIKPIELLEVIDRCVFGSLCSGVVLSGLQLVYDRQLEVFGLTHENVVKEAVWRDNP
jgi:hypothetical protein